MTYSALSTLKSLMRLTGFFDPKQETPRNKLLLALWFYCITFALTTMSAQCVIQLILEKNRDIGKMCYVISVTGVVSGGALQIMYVFANKNKILELFELIEKSFEYTSQTGLLEVNMESYIKKAMFLIYWWASVIVLALICLLAGPLTLKNLRVLPLPAWYPYNWKNNPQYQWSFLVQTIALCLTDLCYLSFEVIFPYLSLIITGQFAILGHNCKNVVYSALLDCGLPKKLVFKFTLGFNGGSGEKLTENERNIINEALNSDDFKNFVNTRLNKCIKLHAALLKICEKIENAFSPFTLVKLFFNRMYIMMDILCILYGIDMTYSVPIALFGCCAFTQLVFFTIFGQIIQSESEQIFYKIYECPWYLCSKQFQQKVMFVLMRARKSVTVTAGKFVVLNNESFLVFINVVFSYVTLFQQVMDK